MAEEQTTYGGFLLRSLLLYFENTTVHGFAYIASELTNILEKIFWILVIITGMSISSFLVNEAFTHWRFNPTKTTAKTYSYSAHKLQVPTVTVCSTRVPEKTQIARMTLNQLQYGCTFDEPVTDLYRRKDEYFADVTDFEYEDWARSIITSPNEETADPYDYDELHVNILGGLSIGRYIRWKDVPVYNDVIADGFKFTTTDAPCSDKIEKLRNERPVKQLIEQLNFTVDYFLQDELKETNDSTTASDHNMPIFGLIRAAKHFSDYDMFNGPAEEFFVQLITDRVLGKERRLGPKSPPLEKIDRHFNPTGEYIDYDTEDEDRAMKLQFALYYYGKAFTRLGNLFTLFIPEDAQLMTAQSPLNIEKDDTGGRDSVFIFLDKVLRAGAGRKEIPFAEQKTTMVDISSMMTPHSLVSYFNFDSGTNFPTYAEYWYTYEKLTDIILANKSHECFKLVNNHYILDAMSCIIRTSVSYFGNLVKTELDRDLVMYAMRHSFLFANNKADADTRYEALREGLEANLQDYQLIASSLGLDQFKRDVSRLEMIFRCTRETRKGQEDCTSLFSQVPSYRGICHAFNVKKLDSLFETEDSAFWTSFKKHFVMQTAEVQTNEKGVERHGMSFVLDMKTRLREPESTYRDPEWSRTELFYITIRDSEHFLDNVQPDVIAVPGTRTEITLSASRYISNSDSFKNLPEKTRGCKFSHEVDSQDKGFLKSYFRDGCRFHCAIQRSLSACNLDCVPWDFPPPFAMENKRLCHGEEALCFQKEMLSTGNSTCDCSSLCQGLKYGLTINTVALDNKKICQEDDDIKRRILADFASPEDSYYLRHQLGDVSSMNTEPWLKGSISAETLFISRTTMMANAKFHVALCRHALATDFAFVNILLNDNEIPLFAHDISNTFIEQLGTLGGTIGLFTGLSLISLVEASFWIIRTVTKIVKKSFSKNENDGEKKAEEDKSIRDTNKATPDDQDDVTVMEIDQEQQTNLT